MSEQSDNRTEQTSEAQSANLSDREPDVEAEEIEARAYAEMPTKPTRARFFGWKGVFIAEMKRSCNVRKACEASWVSRDTAYRAKIDDKAFAAAWSEAKEGRVDDIEEVATQAALDGDPKSGEFVLKALRRAEFGDKLDISLTGTLAHVAVQPADVAAIVARLHPELVQGVKLLPEGSQE